MNTKKILSAILSVVMIFSMTTVPVFADDTIVEISTLAELETFRDAVNGGERYKGKTVKLTADIDLESDEWTPIGTSTNPFDGNFDGAGFTISNLKITGTNDYVGLFGKVGTSAESRNEIKNLTLSNVSVSGGKYTAAIAGCGFVVNFTDCTVTGDINVTGNRYTGGIVGHLYGAVKNCSITDTTDDGGAITALYQVGGIVGYTGEGNTVIENCAVNNVAITATSGGWVGGIAGVAHSGSSISNNTISNITVDGGNDSYAISGLIVGQNIGTESSVSYVVNNAIENSSGTVNGETMTNTSGSMGGEPAVSVVGTNVTFDADGKVASGTFEVELPSSTVSEKSNISENEDGTFGVIDTRIIDVDGELYTSLEEAVEAAEDGDTITLLQDVTDGSGIFIGADTKDITIDFGGYTYTVFKPAVGSVGTVTQGFHIEKNNTITLKNGTINTSNPEEVKMLIQNYANLTLQDLTIDYANGLEGRYALSNNCGEVNITGNTGIIAPTNGIAFDVCNSANYPEGVNVTVNTTGEIIGDIELDTKNSELHTLTINNVKHNGAIKLCDGTTSPKIEITGGTYSSMPDGTYVKKGFEMIENNGTYAISQKEVAKIGDTIYGTLEYAVEAAEDGDTITLLQDVTDGSGIFIGADTKDITIDFGGYTYTVFKPAVGSVGTVTQGFHIEKNNTITLKNGTINTSNPEEVKMLIQNYANLTLQDLTIDYANGLEGRYALSNNCGEVNITGNTGIIAPTNGIAFDVCNSANYPEGVNVTVNTTGEIIGDIELDTKNSELHTLTINNVKHNGAIKLCDGTTSPSVTINGGYFTTDVTDYCAEDKGIAGSVDFDGYGYKVADKADVEDPVAIIGDVVYITFADAVNAAEHDDVIIIKKNSNLTVNLSDSKTFTVKNSLENDIKVNINGTYYLVSAGEEKEIVFTKSSYIAAPGGSVTVSYTVKFETNGGSKIDSVKVKQNKTVSEPTAPVKDGYVFDGWYNDEELKTKYDFDSEVTKSITLYAKWTEEVSDKDEDKDDEKDDSTTEWTNPYSDVAKDAWYYEDVKFATENDLMKGVSEKEFAPNAQLTRAMLVTIIYRNEGEPDVKGSIAFTDVEKGSWYEKAVIWAVENGIVMGVSDDKFAPDVNITREQIATIIFRYANYKKLVLDNNNADISKFADADKISEYAVDAMKYVISAGIINGKTETTLNPGDNATRAEIAAILHRFISLNK